MSNQCHLREFAKLDGEGGYFGNIFFYEDANQIENFIRAKMTYITGVKIIINPENKSKKYIFSCVASRNHGPTRSYQSGYIK